VNAIHFPTLVLARQANMLEFPFTISDMRVECLCVNKSLHSICSSYKAISSLSENVD